MVLLSRPVFSSWSLFNFNSFPNFKVLQVATDSTNPTPKNDWTWIFTGIGFGLFLLFYPNAIRTVFEAISWIPRTIANSRIKESTAGNNYVARKDLEDQLEKAFTDEPYGNYYIIYGNHGVGKTELVTHAAIYDKKQKPSYYDKFILNKLIWNTDYAYRYGVLKIKVRPGQSYQDVFDNLLSHLFIPFSLPNIDLLEAQMNSVHWWWPSIYPTIIFEVERGNVAGEKTAAVNAVRVVAKDLAHTCRCIIVLSDVIAILEAGDDTAREKFIFVDELSIEEAKTFLKKRNCIVADVELSASDFAAYNLLKNEKLKSGVDNSEEIKSQVEIEGEGEETKFENSTMIVNGIDYVFYNIGTNPACLIQLISKNSTGVSVKQFVDEKLADALGELKAFPLQKILQALKENPDGVNPGYFHKLEEKGVDLSNPESVGQIMKKNPNPILYRTDLKRYQLLSTAHKTALRSYVPIVPMN